LHFSTTHTHIHRHFTTRSFSTLPVTGVQKRKQGEKLEGEEWQFYHVDSAIEEESDEVDEFVEEVKEIEA